MEYVEQIAKLSLPGVLNALDTLDVEKYPDRLALLQKRKDELVISEGRLLEKYAGMAKVPLDLEALGKQDLAGGVKIGGFVVKKVMFGYLIRAGGEEFAKTRMSKVMDAKGKPCGTVEGMVMAERDRFILRMDISGKNYYLKQGSTRRGRFPKTDDVYAYLVRSDDALIGEFEVSYGEKPKVKSGFHYAGEEGNLWFLGLGIIHEILFNTDSDT